MKRDRSSFLLEWLGSATRKPLIIRGARQVGKTWLIRNLASLSGKKLIELNFEKRPDFESLFSNNDAKQFITNISAATGESIQAKDCILFLDEIQAAPKLLAKLRWFAEEMPELAVVAAGSLLDFALSDHEFSMPVGRISYLYLEPLSLDEFLTALGHESLRTYLQSYRFPEKIPDAIHQQLLSLFKEYLIIGGMPAAVAAWAHNKKPEMINQIHFDLLATYREDFAKYRGRLSVNRLKDIFASIPLQLGKKFVFTKANHESSTPPLKQALDLLVKARICHEVFATAANGLPLNAEIKEKFFKVILLDSGIVNAILGLTLHDLLSVTELNLINSCGIAEQYVGQQLRTLFPPYVSPSLNYWLRSEMGSNAEVDYVIQHKTHIVPLEVKAGSTGTLKSLHEFMSLKKLKLALRVNSDFPTQVQVRVKTAKGIETDYSLLSIPFYLLSQTHRIIAEAMGPT